MLITVNVTQNRSIGIGSMLGVSVKITVVPSNNIFSELGQNTYDYKDLLSELIDNSIAARVAGELLHVRIRIEVDNELKPTKFIIWDDATGIPEDRLGLAIS